MKQNKMIRPIGERQDPHEYVKLTRERLQTSYALLDTHIKWFTHKNPHGCSICDLLQLAETTLASFESFLGPNLEEELSTGQETLSTSPAKEKMED